MPVLPRLARFAVWDLVDSFVLFLPGVAVASRDGVARPLPLPLAVLVDLRGAVSLPVGLVGAPGPPGRVLCFWPLRGIVLITLIY